MYYKNTTWEKEQKFVWKCPTARWLPGMTPKMFAEMNTNLNYTPMQCVEHCIKREQQLKSLQERCGVQYKEPGRMKEETKDTDPRDEEDEHKVITKDDMIDAGYTPKDTRKREDMSDDRQRRYDREMGANQQAR